MTVVFAEVALQGGRRMLLLRLRPDPLAGLATLLYLLVMWDLSRRLGLKVQRKMLLARLLA